MRKMKNKHAGQKLKQLLAAGLSFSMVFSGVLPAAAAGTETQKRTVAGTPVTEEELKEALAQDAALYPEGGFEFLETQISGEEGTKKQLIIVRRGGTDQTASVEFKAVDVSATYGEDYLLTVDDGIFRKTLEGTGRPLTDTNSYMQVFEDTGEETESEASVVEAQTEGKQEVQAAVRRKSGGSLQAARDSYLDEDSSYVNWQEMDEAQKLEEEKKKEAYNEAYNEFAGNVEGTSYTFTFKPGEYMKTIDIETIDDDIAESDEQVVFLLSNVTAGTLGTTATAYLNIIDNEESEKAIFAMSADEITVDRSAGKATVIINRVSGNNKIASVVIGTGSGTAKAGTDYEEVTKEVVFPQGVTFQQVEIPLKNYEGAPENAQFQVALDPEKSFVEEGCAITTINLTNENAATESLASDEKISTSDNQKQTKAADKSEKFAVSTSASVSGRRKSYSGRINVKTGLELATADYIEVEWKSNEGSHTWTTGKKCKKKTHTDSSRKSYLWLNGEQVASRSDTFNTRTDKIILKGNKQKNNSQLQLEVYTTNENQNATARVSKITVHYPGYEFRIVNDQYNNNNNSNYYQEKIYTDDEGAIAEPGASYKYKLGNKITIAEAKIAKNGEGNFDSSTGSATLYKFGEAIQVQHKWTSNTTSNGVKIEAGAGGNVYFAGYALEEPSSKTYTYLTPGELDSFNQTFLNKYKKNMYNGNVFVLHPIYRPYEARVMFQNSNTAKGFYANGFGTNTILRCTSLDTLKIRAVANKGYAVGGFEIGTYVDDSVRGENKDIDRAKKANEYYREDKNIVVANTQKYASGNYTKSKVKTVKQNSAIPNVITFTPTGEYTYLNPTYTVPTITVEIDPKNNDKKKGAVIYTPDEGDESKVQQGDYQTPMVIRGITMNKPYTLTAVTEDGYKAYFKNFTGDSDKNGVITSTEQADVAKYNFVRTASNGNIYTFLPSFEKTLIYYGFLPKVKNRYAGVISGVVALKDKPVFGSKETKKAINGVQVSVAGQTGVTKADREFGGIDGNGGDGYFYFTDRDFVSGENQTVSFVYGNVTMSASQAVNAANTYVLDAYDTIGISAADAFRIDGNHAVKIAPSGMTNGEYDYRIAIQAYSKNDAVSAKKAIFRFYRKDGTEISGTEKTVESTNQNFTLDFNPGKLGITTGAYMTVQFVDQKGVAYYEHEMGFYFAQALGLMSFISSFNFGGAEKVMDIIGVIDSAFNFGWDGNLDKISTNSDDNQTKTISIGYSFSSDDIDLSVKDAAEAQKDPALSADQKKEKRKKAAESAVDKNGTKNKSKAEVGGSASVEVGFALKIEICQSQNPKHKGEWYFKDMVLAANAAAGVDVLIQYVTPIGVPIRVSIGTKVSGSATFVIEQANGKEYYFIDKSAGENKDRDDAMDTSTGKIDIFNFNPKNADRAMNAYGMFNISPSLDLGAGVGFEFLNLDVHGAAEFDMNFYTLRDQKNTGDVTLSAYIKMKILFFEKKWNIAKKTLNMFGDASSINDWDGGADYRYESLAGMEHISRDYLENRSQWMGESNRKTRSLADSSGLMETILLEGMTPNPDIQMAAISENKILALFLADNPDLSVENGIQLYYSIGTLDGDFERWSRPQCIENDKTTDDAPVLKDLGDRGIFAAWSSADRELTSDDGVIDSLNSMNIHGAFFDKTSNSFGEIQEITKTAPYIYEDEDGDLIGDLTADINPQISIDEESGRMLVFYTKTEYSSSAQDDQGLVGDVANAYSVTAYREYNLTNGTWVSDYEGSSVSQDYEKAWYGQKFLDIVPKKQVKEKLDSEGYWTETPEITDFKPYTYTAENGSLIEQDPIVIESCVTTYNRLALYAYVLDYDGNKATESDRDIYLQIYDYKNRIFTHPIMVTSSDGVGESNISFVKNGDSSILTYLAENTLYAIPVDSIADNLVKADTKLYYINKTKPDGNESEDTSVYMPPTVVAGDKLAEQTSGSTDDAESKTADAQENINTDRTGRITDYRTASDGRYIYAFWLQNDVVLKDGIEPNSEESLKAENQIAESQIYGVRLDLLNGVITDPVKVTNEKGANYVDLASVSVQANDSADGSGDVSNVRMFATKTKSKVEVLSGTDETGKELTQEIVTADTDRQMLVALNFTPEGALSEKGTSLEDITAGKYAQGTIELYNDGMETLEGLTVTVKDAFGNEVHTQKMDDDEKLYGGKTWVIGFAMPVAEDAVSAGFIYTVTDAGNKVLLQGSCSEKIPLQMDVTSLKAETTQRGIIEFEAEVTNNSARYSGSQKINISARIGDAQDYKVITSLTTDNLCPGESGTYKLSYHYDKYDKLFKTGEDADAGDLQATTTFRAEAAAGSGLLAEDDITMKASKEQKLRMNAIQKISVVDDQNRVVDKDYTIEEKKVAQLNTLVESSAYKGSQYEGMDDAVNFDKMNPYGLSVRYVSDNEEVLKVYDNGSIQAGWEQPM